MIAEIVHPRGGKLREFVRRGLRRDIEQGGSLKTYYEVRMKAVAPLLLPLPDDMVNFFVVDLADAFHNRWREVYIAKNRTGDGPDDYPPRWKPVENDQAWVERAKHDPHLQRVYRQNPETERDEVDIAHLSSRELPQTPWREENEAAAFGALHFIRECVTNGPKLDLEIGGAVVHKLWGLRNPLVYETSADSAEEARRASQRFDYRDPRFTEEERDKDRVHVVLATEAYAKISTYVKDMHSIDLVRAKVQEGEVRRQIRNPLPDTPFLHKKEVQSNASALVGELQGAVSSWEYEEKVLPDGTILRKYSKEVNDPEAGLGRTSFDIDLVYKKNRGGSPLHGSVTVYVYTPGEWPRESYMQVETGSRRTAVVSYADYPFHEEDIGTSVKNTQYGVDQARRLISLLPQS